MYSLLLPSLAVNLYCAQTVIVVITFVSGVVTASIIWQEKYSEMQQVKLGSRIIHDPSCGEAKRGPGICPHYPPDKLCNSPTEDSRELSSCKCEPIKLAKLVNTFFRVTDAGVLGTG